MREAAFDDPALAAQAGAVFGPAPRDHGFDAASPEQPAVLVVVIAAVGQDQVGFAAWTTGLASDRPAVQILEQWDQLRNVVAVAAGQRNGERDAARVDKQVVF